MLPLIQSLPHLFDGTKAFVAEPCLKSSLRKPGEVTGTQQPHVLCRGYFHHPNYTFCINQRLRLVIKAGWQVGLLIMPVPNHSMKGWRARNQCGGRAGCAELTMHVMDRAVQVQGLFCTG